jgi:hypothetical protein
MLVTGRDMRKVLVHKMREALNLGDSLSVVSVG